MDNGNEDTLGSEQISPNIKSIADEQDRAEREAAAREDAERKAKETVAIDGIAFDEEETTYRSKDIQQKDSRDLFLNVEGAERLKRAAQAEALKSAVAEKENAERQARELEHSIAEHERIEAKRKAKSEAEALKSAVAEKENAEHQAREEVKKQIKAKQRKELEETNERKRNEEGVHIDAKMQRIAEKQKKAELRRQNKTIRRAKWYAFFWQGRHKAVTIGAVLLFAFFAAAAVFVVSMKHKDAQRLEQEEEYIRYTLNFEGKLAEAGDLVNHNLLDKAMVIYEEMLSQSDADEEKITIYVHRSRALYKSQDYHKTHLGQVIKDANAAFEIDNKSDKALLWLIELYGDIGDKDKVKYYQELYDSVIREQAEKDKNNNQDGIGRG